MWLFFVSFWQRQRQRLGAQLNPGPPLARLQRHSWSETVKTADDERVGCQDTSRDVKGQRSRPRSPRCTWCCVFAVVSLSLLWPSLVENVENNPDRNTVHVIRLDWWEHLQEARGLTCSYPSQPFFMIHSPGFMDN